MRGFFVVSRITAVTTPMPITKTTTTTTKATASINIADRKPLLDRTVDAIIAEADRLGAYAGPVMTRTGRVDEVHLFRDGQLQASIFRPANAPLGVWRGDRDQVPVASAAEAVREGLRLSRAVPTQGNPRGAQVGFGHSVTY
jgi:hypothetical protein